MDWYNSKRFKEIRALHARGDKALMEPCKECTVLYSEGSRTFL